MVRSTGFRQSRHPPFPSRDLVAPCPNCGGPREPRDRDRYCGECRSPEGKMSELFTALGTTIRPLPGVTPPARLPSRSSPFEKLSRFDEWRSIRYNACLKFGHDRFDNSTWDFLIDWLMVEHRKTSGEILQTKRVEVVALLKSAIKACGVQLSPPHVPTARRGGKATRPRLWNLIPTMRLRQQKRSQRPQPWQI